MTEDTRVVFSGTWTLNRPVEPGSVPDRPVPYTRTAEMYRPGFLRVVFRIWAENSNPYALRLENGSGFLRTARDSIAVDAISVTGQRLKADGEPGRRSVTESLYGRVKDAPDWAQEIVRDTLTALGGPA